MPSLNHTQFPHKVESGEKRCSIRARRKYPIKVGDRLFHYVDMRRKPCRKLRVDLCLKVTPIVIDGVRVFLRDRELTAQEIFDLAIADGFTRLEAFWAFSHRKDGRFEGDLLEW